MAITYIIITQHFVVQYKDSYPNKYNQNKFGKKEIELVWLQKIISIIESY